MNDDKETLQHHGILGQRWGIRRYQNADGSLTPAGRKRAQKIKGEYKELTGKKLKGKIPKDDPNKKPIKRLTDTELADRIKRLRAEKEAHGLERDLSSKGSKFIRSVGSNIIAPAAIDAGKNLLTKVFMNMGSEALGLNKSDVHDAYKELKKSTEMAEFRNRKDKAEREMKQRMAKAKLDKMEAQARKLEIQNKRTVELQNKGQDWIQMQFDFDSGTIKKEKK